MIFIRKKTLRHSYKTMLKIIEYKTVLKVEEKALN